MIGQSVHECIFIGACIGVLRLVTPASLIYLGASWFKRGFLISPWLGAYAISESLFFLLVYLPRKRRLQKAAEHPPLLDRAAREALFESCADTTKDVLGYPSKWFMSPDIKRGNVIEWLLWSFFSATPSDAQAEWEEEIESYIARIEDNLGRKLAPGFNNAATSFRLTVDPVVMLHRPLIWYSIVSLTDAYAYARLLWCGFSHFAPASWGQAFPPRPWTVLASHTSVDPDLPYWYRPHRSKDKLPILFLHGIGIGMWPYVPFLREIIAQDPDVGILIIELLPISMRITSPPLSEEVMDHALRHILTSLNLPRVVVCSHSYGTVLTAHLLHSPTLSPLIAGTLLIDPIPFLLHLPTVAHNFVYRTPHTANEWQLWYFASRDPDVSRALSRHFFWHRNLLWKRELDGRRVAVALGGADQIVPAERVRKYLTGEDEPRARWSADGLEVLFYPGLDHATVFDTRDRRRPLLDVLHRFVADI